MDIAEAKPKHGADSGGALLAPPGGFRNEIAAGWCSFPLTEIYTFFRVRPCWLVTMRDNAQKLVLMDYFRKKIASFYSHYVIVRSPKNGYHFHALVAGRLRAGHVKLKRGIHLDIKMIGRQLVSRANIPRDNPFESDDLLSQLRIVVGKARPVVESKRKKALAEDVKDVVFYLINNLMENNKKSFQKYNSLSIRL